MTRSTRKRTVSVSLDADIVEAFEQDGPLSAQINEALREAAHRRNHRRALRSLLERLESEDGPLDAAEDLAAIARYREMLS
jgi:antitoxin CcdA